MFKDRYEAAMLLAEKLTRYKNQDGVILAIPRGGVPIGYVIAKELGLPLELILSKKIGHPYSPEYAIGSVSLQGVVIDENVMDVSSDYIKNEVERLKSVLKEKFNLYMGKRKPVDLNNKIVIIVDDGIATGNTIRATIEAIRRSWPRKIVIAVPVAPPSTVHKLSDLVDEFICLHTPGDFRAVGQYYRDFYPVEDDEVIRLMKEADDIENKKIA